MVRRVRVHHANSINVIFEKQDYEMKSVLIFKAIIERKWVIYELLLTH